MSNIAATTFPRRAGAATARTFKGRPFGRNCRDTVANLGPSVQRGAVAIALVVLLGLPSCIPKVDPPPNIIVIVIDSLRADYLGSQGFEGAISPHLDRFAAESVTFTQCMSQAPWTKPSIASLFTSTHPTTHGMNSNLDTFWKQPTEVDEIEVLSPDFITLAEAVRDAGYTTSARSDNPWLSEVNGYAQGFDRFRPTSKGGLGSPKAILEHVAELRGEAPFFLYLHFMDVHAPYPYRANKFRELSASPSLGGKRRIEPAEAQLRPAYMNTPQTKRFDIGELRDWKASYATGVALADARLGVIFDGLRKSNALDDTLIVVTSDHGEEFLEHGQWEHGKTLCNHQLHVPLMIRFAGATRAGTQDSRLVRLIDLMPTLLKLANHEEALPQMEGHDLFTPDEEGLVALASGLKGHPTFVAAQTRDAKLIWDYPSGALRFFDLSLSPAEQRVSAAPSELASVRERLEAAIRSLADQPAYHAAAPLAEPMSERKLEKFRALGYLE